MGATETLILTNFIRLLTIAFLLLATVKMLLISREASWDGWNLMSISIALLAASVMLNMFKQFGIVFVNVREIIAMVAGLLVAAAFLLSTRLIKNAGKSGGK